MGSLKVEAVVISFTDEEMNVYYILFKDLNFQVLGSESGDGGKFESLSV